MPLTLVPGYKCGNVCFDYKNGAAFVVETEEDVVLVQFRLFLG